MSHVDQREGSGASRVRRLLSRALLVVGGTLAGSAAAWALAAAPASAQEPVDQVTGTTSLTDVTVARHNPFEATLDEATRTPVGRTPVTLDQVVPVPVGEAVRELDTTIRTPRVRESGPPDIGRVTGDLRDAVENFGGWFQTRTSEQSTTEAVAGGDSAQRVTEATPAATAAPVPAGTPVVQGVSRKAGPMWLDLTRQANTALPADTGSSLPGGPSGMPLMPFAPLGAPVHCSCGGDASGSSGGGNGPFSAVSTDRFDAAVARALFPATERNVVAPGKQPGTTPD
ncbi:hypothetical protein [Saccharothrix sp. NRRL B-16314]|uniref:hypothetical protein n=1 Tax=Saccharothrix sp. NRRL B-16314 TaxID=1463825 RepID=UPI0005276D38|nr:hypothetical protein [Saccharothrix sp. NRRL B-16314]